FGERFVQTQRSGNIARDGGDLDRVRQSCAIVVASAVEEDLGLVLEPAKSARVNDAVTVSLIMRAPLRRCLLIYATAGLGAELGVRSERLTLLLLQLLPRHRHRTDRALEELLHGHALQFEKPMNDIFNQVVRTRSTRSDADGSVSVRQPIARF